MTTVVKRRQYMEERILQQLNYIMIYVLICILPSRINISMLIVFLCYFCHFFFVSTFLFSTFTTYLLCTAFIFCLHTRLTKKILTNYVSLTFLSFHILFSIYFFLTFRFRREYPRKMMFYPLSKLLTDYHYSCYCIT